jgi:hypothetical protein
MYTDAATLETRTMDSFPMHPVYEPTTLYPEISAVKHKTAVDRGSNLSIWITHASRPKPTSPSGS